MIKLILNDIKDAVVGFAVVILVFFPFAIPLAFVGWIVEMFTGTFPPPQSSDVAGFYLMYAVAGLFAVFILCIPFIPVIYYYNLKNRKQEVKHDR